jgi:hypothetical protein
MTCQIIDNLLTDKQLKALQSEFVWNPWVPWSMMKNVASGAETGLDTTSGEPWHWYANNCVYKAGQVLNPLWEVIEENLVTPMMERGIINKIQRAKVNFYPSWPEIKKHDQHTDYAEPHGACVFSLNTCDGFTRIGKDIAVPSVANRAVLFDGSTLHNSSNCTTPSGRFNINLNFT